MFLSAVVSAHCRVKTRDELDRLRAAAQVLLLTSTQQQRGNADAFLYVKSANSLARVYLVPRNADKVALQRDFQKSLHRVDMNDGPGIFLLHQPVQPLDIDSVTGLIIHCHAAYKHRVLVHCVSQSLHKIRVVFRRKAHYLEAALLQACHDVGNGRVLYRGCDYPVSGAAVSFQSAAYRGVAALSRARGEYYIALAQL